MGMSFEYYKAGPYLQRMLLLTLLMLILRGRDYHRYGLSSCSNLGL
jgi:hypothetical protein